MVILLGAVVIAFAAAIAAMGLASWRAKEKSLARNFALTES